MDNNPTFMQFLRVKFGSEFEAYQRKHLYRLERETKFPENPEMGYKFKCFIYCDDKWTPVFDMNGELIFYGDEPPPIPIDDPFERVFKLNIKDIQKDIPCK